MYGPSPRRNWCSEALGYLWWFYTPFRTTSVSFIYDLISIRGASDHGLYLNMGYWKDAHTLNEACQGLATLVAEKAELGPHDDLLDVGFGFAEQDMYWLETFGPKQILGVNITRSQVQLACERVAARQMDDRITLLQGSATTLPLRPASFDKVTALECAFHFDTRETFFQEAYRVLRPGGRLVLADVIAMPQPDQWFQRLLYRSVWFSFCTNYFVSKENMDTQATYAQKLTASGFYNVQLASIWNDVYPPLHRWLAQPGTLKRFHPLARFPYYGALCFDPKVIYGALDYIVVSADKPA
jgi:cyclopropane fatty-acyl-phospholipid synthase-like methyltransferase